MQPHGYSAQSAGVTAAGGLPGSISMTGGAARRHAALLITLVLASCSAAWAQEVGTIASLEGSAKIGRGGAWTDAAIGGVVQQGDELRTARPGRLRVVFQDDSVLTMGDDSRVVVDEQVFNPTEGQTRSLLRLLGGKISALVSEYYHQPGAAYEIRTATAVAGVRGTEFIVKYDALSDVTEVAGVHGRAEVHSVLDPKQRGVFVSAREVTTVAAGQFPGPPKRLSDTLFRQYLEGIDFVGRGGTESLTVNHPLLSGATVPKPDQAVASVPAHPQSQLVDLQRDPRTVGSIVQQPVPQGGGPGGGRLRIPF
jgi:hypothetical protein